MPIHGLLAPNFCLIGGSMNIQIVLRKTAREHNLSHYFTGKPCRAGHVALRLTVNGSCEECSAARRKKAYWSNREQNLAAQKLRRDYDDGLAARKRERRRQRDPAMAARDAAREEVEVAIKAAISAGHNTYLISTPCARGHVAPRFVRDRRCVECNRLACRERWRKKQVEAEPERSLLRQAREEKRALAALRKHERASASAIWRAAGEARRMAKANGEVTYLSGRLCPRGHSGLRYVSGGGCAECAALVASSAEKKAYDAEYAARNRDRIVARVRAYNEKTKEARSRKAKEWAAANPEIRRAIAKNYKARRRSQEHSGDSTAAIMAWECAAPKVCHWCGARCVENYHIDHYQPLAKGGRHEVANLVISCPPCNLRKNAKDPYEFAASLGRLF